MKTKSFLTKGVPVLDKPDRIHIDLIDTRPVLYATTNGNTEAFHISKKVAAVLIANGMAYGG